MQVDLKPASDVLAGAMARAASQSTIHPLDTLKVGSTCSFSSRYACCLRIPHALLVLN